MDVKWVRALRTNKLEHIYIVWKGKRKEGNSKMFILPSIASKLDINQAITKASKKLK
jgi:hypothetical protein